MYTYVRMLKVGLIITTDADGRTLNEPPTAIHFVTERSKAASTQQKSVAD